MPNTHFCQNGKEAFRHEWKYDTELLHYKLSRRSPDMGQTAVEKILSRVCGRKVTPGEVIIVQPDLTWIPSGFGMIAVKAMQELGVKNVSRPDQALTWLIDPSFSRQIGEADEHLTRWSKAQGIQVIRGGVPTASLVREGYAQPGKLIVGLDSHSPTMGAMGCISLSVGDTELGVILATGALWTRVPKTIAFRLTGTLPKGSSAKDIALGILKEHGMDVAVNRVAEFIGPGVEKMDMWSRLTLCNMSVEIGAYTGFIALDPIAIEQVGKELVDMGGAVRSDEDALYEKIYEVNMDNIIPMIACPDSMANISEVSAVEGTPVTHAFVGSCTNAWISDLRAAAKIMSGKKVADGLRMIISPVDRRTMLEATEEGLLATFIKAGAVVTQPFCSMCSGLQNYMGAGDVCISSSGRNFRARMGHPDSHIYVASAATVAASVVQGRITDPRNFLED